jgi:transaldolase
MEIPKIEVDEKKFRWELNQNQMATEKLAEGIRKLQKIWKSCNKKFQK